MIQKILASHVDDEGPERLIEEVDQIVLARTAAASCVRGDVGTCRSSV